MRFSRFVCLKGTFVSGIVSALAALAETHKAKAAAKQTRIGPVLLVLIVGLPFVKTSIQPYFPRSPAVPSPLGTLRALAVKSGHSLLKGSHGLDFFPHPPPGAQGGSNMDKHLVK